MRDLEFFERLFSAGRYDDPAKIEVLLDVMFGDAGAYFDQFSKSCEFEIDPGRSLEDLLRSGETGLLTHLLGSMEREPAQVQRALRTVLGLAETYARNTWKLYPESEYFERAFAVTGDLLKIFPGVMSLRRNYADFHLRKGDLDEHRRQEKIGMQYCADFDQRDYHETFGRIGPLSHGEFITCACDDLEIFCHIVDLVLFAGYFNDADVVASHRRLEQTRLESEQLQARSARPYSRITDRLASEAEAVRSERCMAISDRDGLNGRLSPHRRIEIIDFIRKEYLQNLANIQGLHEQLPKLFSHMDPRLDALVFREGVELGLRPAAETVGIIESLSLNLSSMYERTDRKRRHRIIRRFPTLQGMSVAASQLSRDHQHLGKDEVRLVLDGVHSGWDPEDIGFGLQFYRSNRGVEGPVDSVTTFLSTVEKYRAERTILHGLEALGDNVDLYLSYFEPRRLDYILGLKDKGHSTRDKVHLVLAQNRVKQLLGLKEYCRMISSLLGKDRADQDFFSRLCADGEISSESLGSIRRFVSDFNIEDIPVHEHEIPIDSTNPVYRIDIQLGNAGTLTTLAKFYDMRHMGTDDDSFESERAITKFFEYELEKEFGVSTAHSLTHDSSSIGVQAKDGMRYRVNMWHFFDGECLYNRLNGWQGNRTKPMLATEKRECLIQGIDQLALIHSRGLSIGHTPTTRAIVLEDVVANNPDYFTGRAGSTFIGQFERHLGIEVDASVRNGIRNNYGRVNEALSVEAATDPGYYKDASPRNDMIVAGRLIPVDFESRRRLGCVVDLVSKLECGKDYETDEALDHGPEYLTEVEKQNLIDRYLLKKAQLRLKYDIECLGYAVHPASGEIIPVDQQDEYLACLRLLLEKIDITTPDLYHGDPCYSMFVSDERRRTLSHMYRSYARLHRHLEYIGYSARDIDKSLQDHDRARIEINKRCLSYHYHAAMAGLEAALELDPCPQTAELKKFLTAFGDKYCNDAVIRNVIDGRLAA
ncbi:MAG: hypothetical protein ABH879_09195 [archaeon]